MLYLNHFKYQFFWLLILCLLDPMNMIWYVVEATSVETTSVGKLWYIVKPLLLLLLVNCGILWELLSLLQLIHLIQYIIIVLNPITNQIINCSLLVIILHIFLYVFSEIVNTRTFAFVTCFVPVTH